MKKLILIITVVILSSCSLDNKETEKALEQIVVKEQPIVDNGWYENGHIDKENLCTFIVNDSISIIGKMSPIIKEYAYRLYINGKQIMVRPSATFGGIHNSVKSIIDTMEERYFALGTADEYKEPENKNKSECFKFE